MKGLYMMVFLLSVFISSISQVLLKVSAGRQYESKIKEYLNFRVFIAYSFFLASSLLTILAYRGIPLSMGPVLESTGYLWVTVLGWLVLKEKMGMRKVAGLAIIVCGVVLSGVA